jgi:hypothetical protein
VSPIQEGDKLIRTLPTGLRVGFIVDDPGLLTSLMVVKHPTGEIPKHQLRKSDSCEAGRVSAILLRSSQAELLALSTFSLLGKVMNLNQSCLSDLMAVKYSSKSAGLVM